MGHIYHANAKTTEKIREEIQKSNLSIRKLAAKFSLNPKTVQKWKKADRVTDAKCGPTNPHSTVLTETEEQIICEFRKTTKLPLDDVLTSLIDEIPNLKRSNLHRCLQRHNLSRLPKEEKTKKPVREKFKDYELGFVHIDITTVRIEGGRKYYIFVAIERLTKYAYVEIHEAMTVTIAVQFLKNVIADAPFKIHRILTDNGSQFTYELLAKHLRPKNKNHPFDDVCAENGIVHKLTKFAHPWTNGQVEVFNKKIKNHTTKRYHYVNIDSLKKHLMAYLLVYNFQKKLVALKYKTPYATLCELYKKDASLFRKSPYHKNVGRNK